MTYPPETPSSTYGSDPSSPYSADDTSSPYPADDTSPALSTEEAPTAYPDPASAYAGTGTAAVGGTGTFTDPGTSYSGTVGGSDSSTPEVATQQAAKVVDVAKEQAGNVAAETQAQAKNLLGQTRNELQDQAGQQQQRAASGLRSLGSELQKMANNTDHEDGPASEVARQVADRIDTAASWLQDRDPGQVLTEVQRFARQRPGAFLAIAATAGLLAGRLTRGLTADSQSDGAQRDGTYAGTYPDTATSGYAGAYPTDAGFSSGTGLSGGAAMGSQPDSGWPATGTAPDPAGYATGFGSDQSFDTATPPPAVWGQDPVVPEGEGTYYDSGPGGAGTGTQQGTYPASDPGYGTGTGSGRVGQ